VEFQIPVGASNFRFEGVLGIPEFFCGVYGTDCWVPARNEMVPSGYKKEMKSSYEVLQTVGFSRP
jgi:hypothetical protein